MKTITTALLYVGMALSTGAVFAQPAAPAPDPMAKDAPKMTMESCKTHMAATKGATKTKDDITMKKDAACADMMKGMTTDPMKK